MKHNDRGLPYLDTEMLDLIFAHGFQEHYDGADEETNSFLHMLYFLSSYNYRYRQNEIRKLFHAMEEAIGPFINNSEGPLFYCAMGLAIRELYGMHDQTFQYVLRNVTKSKLW